MDLSLLDRDNSDLFRDCTEDDIRNHYNIVQPLVDDTPQDYFIKEMRKAVESGCARTAIDDSVFLYYTHLSSRIAKGACFYGRDNPLMVLALFVDIFGDKRIQRLHFAPHSKKEMLSYKSLLTPKSLQRWNAGAKYVSVRIDKLWTKIDQLMNRTVR